jgi:hypothetical protein
MREADTHRRRNSKQSSSEVILKSAHDGVKERAAAILRSDFRRWARTAAIPESSIGEPWLMRDRKDVLTLMSKRALLNGTPSDVLIARTADLRIHKSHHVFVDRAFFFCGVISPVSSQSTDFPNSRLIASSTAAHGSFAPLSSPDRWLWTMPIRCANSACVMSKPRSSRMRRPTALRSIIEDRS